MKTSFARTFRRRLGADERGNVAMMTALAIIPLTMASLGAVDLTRTIAARVELQDALDAATLAAGRSNTQDPVQLQQIGQRILQQNLSASSDFTLASSSFTLGANGKIVASAQASFRPLLTGLGGGAPTSLSASSEVMRANNILEIAMVLDNTGSMSQSLGAKSGSKISYLKTAAANFVDTMAAASAQSTVSNSIKISLVPFSNMVRVDAATYRSATWMDQSGVSPLNNEIFTTAQGQTQVGDRWAYFDKIDAWRGCVEMRKAPYDIQDTAPTSSDPASLFTPMFAPDEFDGDGGNDYVTDPKDSKGKALNWWTAQGDINKYKATGLKVTPGASRGPNAGCGMQPVQRLTTDFTALKSAINAMVAQGETNIPNGLMWGWHTLSPNAPFADGVAYLTPKHKKIVVLMTDGENTMMARGGNNNSTYSAAGFVWQGRVLKADGTALNQITSTEADRTAALDSRLQKLCTNMKAANVAIEIYAIGVGVTSSSRTLLQSCASDTDHYFDVQAGSDLTATFQSIANQIAQLHLSK